MLVVFNNTYIFEDRRLDKIYLDTTFAVKSNVYRTFPSETDGLKGLLAKILPI